MTLVRPLEGSDYSDWMRLWRAYQEFYKVDIPEATSRITWSRLLDPSEPMWGALAVVDGQCVGLVHHIRHRSCWTEGDYGYLQDLYVQPEVRGQSLGRALIEHVYGTATAMGCSRVYWLTHETNSEAMRLYAKVAERSGFVQYRKALPAAPASPVNRT